MRILVFHGYLLSGTGSNVYNANLAAALRSAGHEVHLFSQDRHPERLDFVDAVGEWRDGQLIVRTLREPVRCTVYRPDIGPVLPVYVADRYEGVDARPFAELSQQELDHYLNANVEAVREVAERVAPDIALANHLVMGPVILARSLEGRLPFAVVVHGSALEYTVKPYPRFLPYAQEGLATARCVLVGSRHTAESLWTALDDPALPARTRLGPPGVDIKAFHARNPEAAAAALRRLLGHLAAQPPSPEDGSSFSRDTPAAARALEQLRPGEDRIVLFLGKEIVAKGLDLLLAAWPLVLQRQPDARLVVVGFGAWHPTAVRMAAALADRNLDAVREIAEEGPGAEGGRPGPLQHLLAFLDSLKGETRRRFLAGAPGMDKRVVFTGRLEHEEITDLLPACEALVVPSTFPEAYGMVAAEAASCGALPIIADHSGLGEVSRVLEASLPHEVAPWLRFQLDDEAVPHLAACLIGWLEAPAELRERTRHALTRTAGERFSWEGVAHTVLAAAEGRLDDLPRIPSLR
ncbi:MAG: glycosyltransferase family 4 protein [Pseudonocardiales bacterium]|nr:glycosyltransferase family 4 protein [Pseudonocardiales bacterium]